MRKLSFVEKCKFVEEENGSTGKYLTPELFLELYTSVGWEPPCIAQVKRTLGNTLATITAYDN